MYPLSRNTDTYGLTGPLCLLIVMGLCWYFSAIFNPLFQYDRELLTDGQLWRVFTAHFVHSNSDHFLLNSAGLGLLWILHGAHYRPALFLRLTVFLAVTCSLMLHFFSTTTDQYLGMSGVLHGLIIWGAYKDIRVGMTTGYLLFGGTWVKILYEQLAGPSAEITQLIGVQVAIDAHLYGALAGSILVIVLAVISRESPEKRVQKKGAGVSA